MKTLLSGSAICAAMLLPHAAAAQVDHSGHQMTTPAPSPPADDRSPGDHADHAPEDMPCCPDCGEADCAGDCCDKPCCALRRDDAAAPAPDAPTAMTMTAQAHDAGQADHAAMGHATADARPAEGSGTSRLPANEGAMHGLHLPVGDDWMAMLHGYAWGVYTDQTGPRGDDKAYVQSMAMLTASRETGWGRVQGRAMLSLEPAMRHDGYPNLFATGEIAYGQPLVDRQHPHDLFMELAARVDVDLGEGASAFVYGGPVGEPAIGPSAFMHRGSATYNPEAPITHHWFDSTHITYGVVTGGLATWRFQIEASAFRGREPDEFRWNIESPKLDSWSVRGTWNPAPEWAVQASHARLESPEASHPEDDERRTTVSVQYASRNGLSALAAFSNKDIVGEGDFTAWLAEANWNIDERHTLFGRFENVNNAELFPDHDDPLHDRAFRVSKFQAGYAYRLPLTGPLGLALGGTIAAFAKPDALDSVYGDSPMGYTLFARLSLGH